MEIAETTEYLQQLISIALSKAYKNGEKLLAWLCTCKEVGIIQQQFSRSSISSSR